MEGMQ